MIEKRKPQILSRSRRTGDGRGKKTRGEDTPVTKLDNKIKPIDSSLLGLPSQSSSLDYLDHRGCSAIRVMRSFEPSKNSTVVFSTLIVSRLRTIILRKQLRDSRSFRGNRRLSFLQSSTSRYVECIISLDRFILLLMKLMKEIEKQQRKQEVISSYAISRNTMT